MASLEKNKKIKTTEDLINESFNIDSPPPNLQGKGKELTTEDHVRIQKLAQPIIDQMQKTRTESTFLGTGEETTKKGRGRPKKSIPDASVTINPFSNTTPLRKSQEAQPQEQPKKGWGNQAILHEKIIAFCKLYPHLQSKIPVNSLHEYPDTQLEEMIKFCKTNGNTRSGIESGLVKTAFFMLLEHFEYACRLAAGFIEVPDIVKFLGQLPPGSFSEFVKLSAAADGRDGINTDLEEISIDLIGYLPNTPITRLVTKTAYKLYDYTSFAKNDRLKGIGEKASSIRVDPKKFINDINKI